LNHFSKIILLHYNPALYLIIFFLLIISCKDVPVIKKVINSELSDTITENKQDTLCKKKRVLSNFELFLVQKGFVDVLEIDTTLIIDIKYSCNDNFLGFDLYGDFNRCYLAKDVANMLVYAHELLKDSFPDYRFIVYDGLRPQSIQQIMWDKVKMPESEKPKFLSKPEYGSVHNYGAAVDLSIIKTNGELLDMGTLFDSFDERAYPINENMYLKSGQLSQQQVANRKLLRFVMEAAGFFNIQTEWWHFNACYRKEARKKYALVESFDQKPFETIAEAEVKVVHEAIPEIESVKVTFRVQLLATKQNLKVTDSRFLGFPVERYNHDGLYKYTSGEFTDVAKAFEYRDNILSKGYPQAFVAGFKNGKRIGFQEAIDLIN
jgi:D-alanyl-D-alanine dipeptidase